MSKKKKKKVDDWTSFIVRLLSRKRSNRRFVIPKDYLLSLADKIYRINPSKAIAYNTLKDVYCTGHKNGFEKNQNDRIFFRDKQEKQFNNAWNKFKDEVDDLIHKKPTA